MKTIKLHDKEFRLLIKEELIDKEIKRVAEEINRDMKDKEPIFLSVLNGSFMFTSDLLKHINLKNTEVSFIKFTSYCGTNSTDRINSLIGLNEKIKGRNIVILEDMIDTGKSMEHLINTLKAEEPASICIATMFFKPKALKTGRIPDYNAMILENDFVVGRGLDYDGLGRNFPDLYIIC